MRIYHTLFFFCFAIHVSAQKIYGEVKNAKGEIVPFASVIIKGSSVGASANNKAQYALALKAGTYTVVCQSVGYTKNEKQITITVQDVEVNFVLNEQQYTMNDVVVKKGEDPAYEIMRNAIKRRDEHLNELKEYQTDVYIKGKMLLRDFPDKFFGQKMDFEDGDSSKKKVLFLSETYAKYSVRGKNDKKIEVTSTKVSGSSDGFGFANPQILSFYEPSIQMGNLNPRGFVSPLANSAFSLYRFKYEGSFSEDGKLINRIKVIPKRTYEPLFNGIINIVEDDWRIHSVDLTIFKENQMQFLDTLNIQQLYVPINALQWVPKSQVMYIAGKFLAFDFYGSFLQVFDKYNLQPNFERKFFDNIILKYDTGSNKKTLAHWDSIRPIPLSVEEITDYRKKDSLEQKRKDPNYLDSLDRINNKIKPFDLFVSGIGISNRKKKENITIDPLLQAISFNTVEGWVAEVDVNYRKRFDETSRRSLVITPTVRYGFSNKHFNASIAGTYSFGKKYFNNINAAFGKKVFQFNNANPINPFDNTFVTLNWKCNYMKLYEAWFARIGYSAGLGNGFTLNAKLKYQDRLPLLNSDTTSQWRNPSGNKYTDNYPTELSTTPMAANKALTATIGFNWQIGARYIQFPDRLINIGSKYPTIGFQFTYGIPKILGSDADFAKWKLSVDDNFNMRLGGSFNYKFSIGGFLSKNNVAIPDYQHFNGNQLFFASAYMNSFQLAPYYRYSNTEDFYATGNVEWHLNGLLSNKIPFFKKLNWFFVGGANTFFVNKNNYYLEVFGGVENILKVMRLDFIAGYSPQQNVVTGFRLSIPFFGGSTLKNDE